MQQGQLVDELEEPAAPADPLGGCVRPGWRGAERNAVSHAQVEHAAERRFHVRVIVLAGMPQRDRRVVGAHVHHVQVRRRDDLGRALQAGHRLDVGDHGRRLVAAPQPVGIVLRVRVVGAAVAGCPGAAAERRVLDQIDQLGHLPGRFGARELDADHPRVQQPRHLGAVQLADLGDDRNAVVAGREHEVGKLAAFEHAVLLLDEDEVEAGVAEDLDQRRPQVLDRHRAEQWRPAAHAPPEAASERRRVMLRAAVVLSGPGHRHPPLSRVGVSAIVRISYGSCG